MSKERMKVERKEKALVKLPQDFVTRMKNMLPDEYEAFLDTYEEAEKTNGLRVNELKISAKDFPSLSPFALSAVPFCPSGFYYPKDDRPGKHPFHQAGLYYIQEPSAMFPVEVLAPEPGEKVLDLCAAPGGKSTHIAAFMKQRGLLVANEIHPKRAKALSENIERLGVRNALVLNETPKRLSDRWKSCFDRILVDAPCSGEGMFRKEPQALEQWSPEHVASCALMQKEILEDAYQMLKPGGILVYSTCTFSTEENEQTVARFLDQYPNMEVLPIEKTYGIADGVVPNDSDHQRLKAVAASAARLWPHRLKGEGHFTVKLRKSAASAAPGAVKKRKGRLSSERLSQLQQFENTTFQQPFDRAKLFEHRHELFALPDDCPDFQGLKVIRPGLHLGTFKKNRFEPNHALALASEPSAVKQTITLSLAGEEWKAYLRGETLPTGGDRGWTLVTIEGFPLGWGKEVKGTLKNFYPKGLRNHF